MEQGSTLAPLLLVVGLAFLVPLVLSRFRRLQIPVVVGEILAGIVIGRSGFNLVQEDPTLEVLAALGFAFLMFLSGLELDFSMLGGVTGGTSLRQNPVVLGFAILALTVASALVIALGLTSLGLAGTPWLLALILSTTSLGIVLPVLRERDISGSLYGQTILLAALIADFVTMVLITVVVAVLSGGLTLEVLLVGVLLIAFILATRYGRRFARSHRLRRALDELAHATVQIKVRGALAVMFAFVVLSEVLGAEVILGAFLAGLLLSLIAVPGDSGDQEARHKLDAIGFGFIIPIFFIMVGVRFDLPALLQDASALVLFPALLVAAYLVKLLPTSLLLRGVQDRRQSLAAGILLSARLSLIIAASAIGLRLGIISEALNADIVLVAVVTSTLSPALFNRVLKPGEAPAPKTTLIVGAGRTGILLAQRLEEQNVPLLVLDNDHERVARVAQLGMDALQVEPSTAAGLLQAGIERAQALAVTTGDDEYNLAVCRLARSSFGVDHIIAYLQDATLLREFEQIGVQVVNPALASASVMDSLLRYPDAFTLLTSVADDKDVVEVELRNPECAGRRLRDMRLPGDVLVLAVRRRGELVVPHGYNRLEQGDHVTLVGTRDVVEEAAALLRG